MTISQRYKFLYTQIRKISNAYNFLIKDVEFQEILDILSDLKRSIYNQDNGYYHYLSAKEQYDYQEVLINKLDDLENKILLF